jgi:hypothetical protein
LRAIQSAKQRFRRRRRRRRRRTYTRPSSAILSSATLNTSTIVCVTIFGPSNYLPSALCHNFIANRRRVKAHSASALSQRVVLMAAPARSADDIKSIVKKVFFLSHYFVYGSASSSGFVAYTKFCKGDGKHASKVSRNKTGTG